MKNYFSLLATVCIHHWRILLASSLGSVVIYYSFLLLLTMLRFGEIPNYFVVHDVLHVYSLVIEGTPSWSDMLPIMIEEAWLETGYKHPDYYGIATWSLMLIPPKMFLVFIMGLLLGVFASLIVYSRNGSCHLQTDKRLYAAAGMSTGLISLTSATLSWVVCCATPSWVVALAMLGMHASLALWLEPLGNFMTVIALLLMFWIIFRQLKLLLNANTTTVGNNRIIHN